MPRMRRYAQLSQTQHKLFLVCSDDTLRGMNPEFTEQALDVLMMVESEMRALEDTMCEKHDQNKHSASRSRL